LCSKSSNEAAIMQRVFDWVGKVPCASEDGYSSLGGNGYQG
jgi:hypothetical protein